MKHFPGVEFLADLKSMHRRNSREKERREMRTDTDRWRGEKREEMSRDRFIEFLSLSLSLSLPLSLCAPKPGDLTVLYNLVKTPKH